MQVCGRKSLMLVQIYNSFAAKSPVVSVVYVPEHASMCSSCVYAATSERELAVYSRHLCMCVCVCVYAYVRMRTPFGLMCLATRSWSWANGWLRFCHQNANLVLPRDVYTMMPRLCAITCGCWQPQHERKPRQNQQRIMILQTDAYIAHVCLQCALKIGTCICSTRVHGINPRDPGMGRYFQFWQCWWKSRISPGCAIHYIRHTHT